MSGFTNRCNLIPFPSTGVPKPKVSNLLNPHDSPFSSNIFLSAVVNKTKMNNVAPEAFQKAKKDRSKSMSLSKRNVPIQMERIGVEHRPGSVAIKVIGNQTTRNKQSNDPIDNSNPMDMEVSKSLKIARKNKFEIYR